MGQSLDYTIADDCFINDETYSIDTIDGDPAADYPWIVLDSPTKTLSITATDSTWANFGCPNANDEERNTVCEGSWKIVIRVQSSSGTDLGITQEFTLDFLDRFPKFDSLSSESYIFLESEFQYFVNTTNTNNYIIDVDGTPIDDVSWISFDSVRQKLVIGAADSTLNAFECSSRDDCDKNFLVTVKA